MNRTTSLLFRKGTFKLSSKNLEHRAFFASFPPGSTSDLPPWKDLSTAQRHRLHQIIRVNHAGELGAQRIYQGQLAVLGRSDVAPLLVEMGEHEKVHLDTFNTYLKRYEIRGTVLQPLWHLAGYTLGFVTALLGKETAMACTEAVETVVGEHYNNQLKEIKAMDNGSMNVLEKTIQQFRDDELSHLHTAVEHDAQKAPGHHLLSTVIRHGCLGAIYASERI